MEGASDLKPFHELIFWYHEEVAKCGKVMIMHAHGHHLSVLLYERSLFHLAKSLKDRMRTLNDQDKIDDLGLYLRNIEYLMQVVKVHMAESLKRAKEHLQTDLGIETPILDYLSNKLESQRESQLGGRSLENLRLSSIPVVRTSPGTILVQSPPSPSSLNAQNTLTLPNVPTFGQSTIMQSPNAVPVIPSGSFLPSGLPRGL